MTTPIYFYAINGERQVYLFLNLDVGITIRYGIIEKW